MTSILQTGVTRLAVLDTNGNKTATYYLPPPDDDGLTINWEEKGFNAELVTGGELNRRLGWLPVITMSWSIYDDMNANYGYTIGSASGDQLDFQSLETILSSTAPTYLEVSPGLTAGGMLVNQVTVDATGIKVGSLNSNVRITFRSGTIYQSMSLGAF